MRIYESNWKLNKACANHGKGEVPSLTLKENKQGVAKVVVFSDVHLGQAAFNQELFEKYLTLVEQEDLYIALGGDLMEFAIPVHMPHTTLEQTLSTDKQIDTIRGYLEPLRDRILFMTNGNHENRQWKRTGTDVSKHLAEAFGCFYSKNGGMVNLNVGKQSYYMFLTHGHSGGQANIWSEPEKRWSFNPQADIVALGHIHHLATKAVPKFEIVNGDLRRRYVHFVRTGSFLTNASYAMEVGYPPTLDGSPILTFHGKRKEIEVDCSGETRWQDG